MAVNQHCYMTPQYLKQKIKWCLSPIINHIHTLNWTIWLIFLAIMLHKYLKSPTEDSSLWPYLWLMIAVSYLPCFGAGVRMERERCAKLAEKRSKEKYYCYDCTPPVEFTLADVIRNDSKGEKLFYPDNRGIYNPVD